MKKVTIDLSAISHRLVVFIIIVVVILAEVVASSLFFPGLVQDNLSLGEQLTTLTTEVERQEKDLQLLSSQDESVILGNYDKVIFALPDEKKVSGVITGVTTLAKTAGVFLDHLEFSPGTISTGSGQVSIVPITSVAAVAALPLGIEATPATIAVSGTRTQMSTFLTSLPNTSQLIGVNAVTLNPKSADAWNAQIGIMIFYQPSKDTRMVWGTLKPLTEEQQAMIDTLGSEDIFVP